MRNFNIAFLFFISVYCISCLGEDGISISPGDVCDLDNVVEKNGRLIGLDLLDLTETNTFEDNLDHADDLDIEFFALHLPWSSIEISPNEYVDPDNALFLLNEVADDEKLLFSLTIRPIDLSGKTVPDDLVDLRFNDFEMIDRFKKLVTYIFTRVDADILLNFQIGNEIDGYDTSGEDPLFWEDYGEFLSQVNDFIKLTNPEVQVGFTGTLKGLVEEPTRFNTLLENVDLLGVTYYPLEDDFDVKRPSTLEDDFDDLLEVYTDKPIYVQEIGYQTSSENKSNETKQADFFCNLFSYWDDHVEEIQSVNIVRLNDLSTLAATNLAAPYGIDDDGFIEYLRSLGIRTQEGEGEEKKAFEVIKDHMDERGW